MIETTAAAVRTFTWTWYLAFVAWREARGASVDARLAVMFCILNRVARGGWWGRTISKVAVKAWQFSSLTDPRDRQLTTWPTEDDASWFECVSLARKAMAGEIDNPVPGADSYHDDSIVPPAWTKGARLVAKIDNLTFYDVDHDYEAPALVAAAEAGGVSPEFAAKLEAFLS